MKRILLLRIASVCLPPEGVRPFRSFLTRGKSCPSGPRANPAPLPSQKKIRTPPSPSPPTLPPPALPSHPCELPLPLPLPSPSTPHPPPRRSHLSSGGQSTPWSAPCGHRQPPPPPHTRTPTHTRPPTCLPGCQTAAPAARRTRRSEDDPEDGSAGIWAGPHARQPDARRSADSPPQPGRLCEISCPRRRRRRRRRRRPSGIGAVL